MSIRIPDAAKEAMLDLMLAENLTLRLFTNDVEAGLTEAQINALTAASFTEATFTGYTSKALTGGSWTTTAADPATATYAQQTFTRSGGSSQTVRGYYVTRTTGGALRWHDYFPGPITLVNVSDNIVTTPTFDLDDDRSATVAARGIVGTPQTLTSNSAAYAADATTDFALANVPVDVTRRYRVVLHSQLLVSASALWNINLYVDGVLHTTMHTVNLEGTEPRDTIDTSIIWEPATGTPDLDIRVDEVVASGDISFEAAATLPRSFYVEDVGPR